MEGRDGGGGCYPGVPVTPRTDSVYHCGSAGKQRESWLMPSTEVKQFEKVSVQSYLKSFVKLVKII